MKTPRPARVSPFVDNVVDNGVEGGLMLYDADCGFCSAAVDVARGPLFGTTCRAIAVQRADLDALGLDRDACLLAMHVVDRRGGVRIGSDAFAEILLNSRPPWPVFGRAMFLPGIRAIAQACYGFLARNRHRLPGGDSACELP